MIAFDRLLRPHIAAAPAYRPVQPPERRARGAQPIIKLDANENPYGPPPGIADALARLPNAHRYPDPESRHLRAALAAHHNLPADNLLVGAGADELIDLIMRLFLAPGDVLLDCPPTFGMYAFDAGLHAARVVRVPRQPDFSLDLAAIERAVVRLRPKLLFLANPNNPDGGLIPPAHLERLLQLPLILVLDEAYIEFAPPGHSRLHQVLQRQNLIVLRTFSKWAGLAGLRVGWGVFPGWLMPHLWKAKQPYNVSVIAQQAARLALCRADWLAETRDKIVAERERLFARLDALPWLSPYPSAANFILCRVQESPRSTERLPPRSAAQLTQDLARQGILVRHFDKPGLADHIRISVGTPDHTARLLRAIQEWGKG